MALDAKRRGLDRLFRRSAPPAALTDSAKNYEQIAKAVDAVAAGQWPGDPPPKRAVLWEITDEKLPRLANAMPAAARWILHPGASNRQPDYKSGVGSSKRIFRLYESGELRPQVIRPLFPERPAPASRRPPSPVRKKDWRGV
jgi:hypothetical protein